MLDPAEIEARTPVWEALAELWLDTRLDPKDLDDIARRLSATTLTIEQLRHIYRAEVAPALGVNARSVAGEWSGWNREWLVARIVANLRDRPRRTRWLAAFPPTRWAMTWASEAHWRAVVERVRELRLAAAK